MSEAASAAGGPDSATAGEPVATAQLLGKQFVVDHESLLKNGAGYGDFLGSVVFFVRGWRTRGVVDLGALRKPLVDDVDANENADAAPPLRHPVGDDPSPNPSDTRASDSSNSSRFSTVSFASNSSRRSSVLLVCTDDFAHNGAGHPNSGV